MQPQTDGSFAAALRRLRMERSLTQEELAERAGLTVKAVGALERGERTRPYPHTVRSLADALGLDEHERAGLVAVVPERGTRPLEAASPLPTSLAPTSPLIGRDAEVDRLCELLLSGLRLITISGPGGVGKTRVALAVMARLGPSFSGGTGIVDLASTHESGLVLERVAAELGVPERSSGDVTSRLVAALNGRRLLVLLDNFEHLLGAAPSVADLVAKCPDLVLLVTSRAALRVRSEHEVVLESLPVPESDTQEDVIASAAAQLFLDRTASAGVPLELDAENAPVIAALCRRLDGLPLAVELAAAGARLLTPAALLAGLDTDDRPPGPRDLAGRQSTMSAALDWSLDLLEPVQVRLFVRLATFSGGFTLEAAEKVATDGDGLLAPLGVLVEHSLVVRAPSPDDLPRFRLLEPIRQHAAQRLGSSGEATVFADRHARWFHDRALSAGPVLHGSGLKVELDRLEADHANLRSAYVRLLELDRVADAAEMAGSLWLYLALRGHAREGISWLELTGAAASDLARLRALTGRMGLLFMTGDIARMRADSVAVVPLAARVDDVALAAEALTLAGHAAVFAGDLDEAGRLLNEALVRAEEAGTLWVRAHALVALGQLALVRADHGEADRVLGRALETARGLGNPFTLATCLTRRATFTALRGDTVATATLLGESIAVSVDAGMSWTLSYALPALAGVAVRLGEPATAATLFGASASLSADEAVDPRFQVSRDLARNDLEVARSQLGDQAFGVAWDKGRAVPRAEVAELAADLTRRALG